MKASYNALLITVMSTLLAHTTYAQTCNSQIKKVVPDTRYQIIEGSNGSEVKDIKTGLIWQRCSVGQMWANNQCYGTPQSYTWSEALQKPKLWVTVIACPM
jgi:hypothetical protein